MTQKNDLWLRLDKLCAAARKIYLSNGLLEPNHELEEDFASVLREIGPHDEAILWHEGCAILAELKGDLRKAAHHRNCEIEAMKRLHEIVRETVSDPQAAAGVLSDREQIDLDERIRILDNLRTR